jgi:hypothetical protein
MSNPLWPYRIKFAHVRTLSWQATPGLSGILHASDAF